MGEAVGAVVGNPIEKPRTFVADTCDPNCTQTRIHLLSQGRFATVAHRLRRLFLWPDWSHMGGIKSSWVGAVLCIMTMLYALGRHG